MAQSLTSLGNQLRDLNKGIGEFTSQSNESERVIISLTRALVFVGIVQALATVAQVFIAYI